MYVSGYFNHIKIFFIKILFHIKIFCKNWPKILCKKKKNSKLIKISILLNKNVCVNIFCKCNNTFELVHYFQKLYEPSEFVGPY